jgi:hypothetical protein
MTQSPKQRMSFVAAVLLGAAPIGFGLFRRVQTGSDSRMLWMAVAATIFTAGVMAASIGRRRTLHAAYIQATIILIVSTLTAAAVGFFLGARAPFGLGAVALVLGSCLAASSVFVALSRSRSGKGNTSAVKR